MNGGNLPPSGDDTPKVYRVTTNLSASEAGGIAARHADMDAQPPYDRPEVSPRIEEAQRRLAEMGLGYRPQTAPQEHQYAARLFNFGFRWSPKHDDPDKLQIAIEGQVREMYKEDVNKATDEELKLLKKAMLAQKSIVSESHQHRVTPAVAGIGQKNVELVPHPEGFMHGYTIKYTTFVPENIRLPGSQARSRRHEIRWDRLHVEAYFAALQIGPLERNLNNMIDLFLMDITLIEACEMYNLQHDDKIVITSSESSNTPKSIILISAGKEYRLLEDSGFTHKELFDRMRQAFATQGSCELNELFHFLIERIEALAIIKFHKRHNNALPFRVIPERAGLCHGFEFREAPYAQRNVIWKVNMTDASNLLHTTETQMRVRGMVNQLEKMLSDAYIHFYNAKVLPARHAHERVQGRPTSGPPGHVQHGRWF